MQAFIVKHWRTLLLALGINGPQIWNGIKWLWDWLGRIDLVANHVGDLREFAGMIGFLTNPPPWMVFVTGAIGVIIILWDIRRPETLRTVAIPKNRMALFLGIAVVCFIATGAFGYAAYWRYKNPPPVPPPAPSELLSRAERDFRHSGGISPHDEKISLLPNVALEVTVKLWM